MFSGERPNDLPVRSGSRESALTTPIQHRFASLSNKWNMVKKKKKSINKGGNKTVLVLNEMIVYI